MIRATAVWRWAAASNERAAANARVAATECARRLVERAEVEQYLAELERPTAETSARAVAAGR